VLTVSGGTVYWSPIGPESAYEVAISNDVRGAGDRVTHYLATPRTPGEIQFYTPTLSPGETVYIGVTTAGGTIWSEQEATVTAPEAEPPPTPTAPVLSVSGNTIHWTALPGVSSYTLATVRNPASTRDTTYSTVTGTSFTPPAVPGQTVNYGLAAHTPAAGPWALEVSIAYPQSEPPPSEEPEPPPSESGGALGELKGPFVKGITANFAGEGPNNVPEEVSEMRSIGVNWTREALDWSETEPQRGVFAWSSFDRVVAEAKANGISILPIVGYAPYWTSPRDSAAYAEFVAAAVARYGPGTSANLKWWELWNEPYFAYAWSGQTPEPEAYARDALAAAQAARHISPTVKLLISADYQEAGQTGGSSTEEKTWINDMFTAAPTLGKWIDGVSVHPYGGDPSLPLKEAGGYLDTSGQWGFQRIGTIREKFLAHGVDVPYWITEEGWSTWDVSEATLAHNYTDLFIQIKARPWVRALFPFGLREDAAHPTNNQPGFGLLKYGTREPKSAWPILQEGFKALN
jgi:polysaccharide biosynthesis protein PslG